MKWNLCVCVFFKKCSLKCFSLFPADRIRIAYQRTWFQIATDTCMRFVSFVLFEGANILWVIEDQVSVLLHGIMLPKWKGASVKEAEVLLKTSPSRADFILRKVLYPGDKQNVLEKSNVLIRGMSEWVLTTPEIQHRYYYYYLFPEN